MDKGKKFFPKFSQTPNAVTLEPGSEAVGAKLHGQKGNNPDHQLRSLSVG